MVKLTKEQIKKYIADGGENCPVCGSANISANSDNDLNSNRFYQIVKCHTCHAHWTDGYSLDSVGTGEGEDYEFIYPELPDYEPPKVEPVRTQTTTSIPRGYRKMCFTCQWRRDCVATTLKELRKRWPNPFPGSVTAAIVIREFLGGSFKSDEDIARFLEQIASEG